MIIVWGGEFGRTPMAQGNGRDHHIKSFSHFICGSGIKPGITHGATYDLGYNAVQDVVNVHDMHATMLHAPQLSSARWAIRLNHPVLF